MNASLKANLTKIAVDNHLVDETLETRKSDSLDFSDCAVWNIEAALGAAYALGHADANRNVATYSATENDGCVIVTRSTDGKTIEFPYSKLDMECPRNDAIAQAIFCDDATWG